MKKNINKISLGISLMFYASLSWGINPSSPPQEQPTYPSGRPNMPSDTGATGSGKPATSTAVNPANPNARFYNSQGGLSEEGKQELYQIKYNEASEATPERSKLAEDLERADTTNPQMRGGITDRKPASPSDSSKNPTSASSPGDNDDSNPEPYVTQDDPAVDSNPPSADSDSGMDVKGSMADLNKEIGNSKNAQQSFHMCSKYSKEAKDKLKDLDKARKHAEKDLEHLEKYVYRGKPGMTEASNHIRNNLNNVHIPKADNAVSDLQSKCTSTAQDAGTVASNAGTAKKGMSPWLAGGIGAAVGLGAGALLFSGGGKKKDKSNNNSAATSAPTTATVTTTPPNPTPTTTPPPTQISGGGSNNPNSGNPVKTTSTNPPPSSSGSGNIDSTGTVNPSSSGGTIGSASVSAGRSLATQGKKCEPNSKDPVCIRRARLLKEAR